MSDRGGRQNTAGFVEVVDAIYDLARVQIALSSEANSKSDLIRRLSSAAMPPSRIAHLLDMPAKDVTSALAKAKKRQEREVKSGDGQLQLGGHDDG